MTVDITSAKRSIRGALPPRSEWLFRWFRWYARRYCARHLHAVRLARWGRPPVLDRPAIVVMNHPSWWDPLIAYVLSRLFEDRVDWGVIESAALRQYRFLGRAGLFGVETGSTVGARRFLATASAILSDPRATIWLTGQGKFADVRERPITLRSGVGHLAANVSDGLIVPLALEIVFWDQRTPEALAAFGEPIRTGDHPEWSPHDWTAAIEHALQVTADRLAADAMARDPERFDVLIDGRTGVGGVYDCWRRLASWRRGESFRSDHH